MAISNAVRTPRRRRESSRLAILDAALALCREEGYARLSVEGIAERAGVSKQTIYRWWPSRGAVLLEALEREATDVAIYPDTDDLLADVRTTIIQVARFHANPNLGPLLAALIAEAQQDPSMAPMLLERFMRPRRAPIVDRLRRAQEAGQLPQTVDVEAVIEVIFGALFHRLLLRSGPIDDTYATYVVETVFGGAAAVRQTDSVRARES